MGVVAHWGWPQAAIVGAAGSILQWERDDSGLLAYVAMLGLAGEPVLVRSRPDRRLVVAPRCHRICDGTVSKISTPAAPSSGFVDVFSLARRAVRIGCARPSVIPGLRRCLGSTRLRTSPRPSYSATSRRESTSSGSYPPDDLRFLRLELLLREQPLSLNSPRRTIA